MRAVRQPLLGERRRVTVPEVTSTAKSCARSRSISGTDGEHFADAGAVHPDQRASGRGCAWLRRGAPAAAPDVPCRGQPPRQQVRRHGEPAPDAN